MSKSLTPEQQEINIWIGKLDEVAHEYESRWGIDRLPNLVSPQTQVKWNTQIQKLNNAISENDLPAVRDLAQGTIRGYKRLEDEAVALGATKHQPDVWDIRSPETGNHYRICKTLNDARQWAFQPDVVCYSLAEIARILDSRDLVTLHPPKAKGPDTKAPAFDFKRGDSMEF